MLSKTQLFKRLHALDQFHLISYLYETADGRHVAILREKPYKGQPYSYVLKEIIFCIREEANALYGSDVKGHLPEIELTFHV